MRKGYQNTRQTKTHHKNTKNLHRSSYKSAHVLLTSLNVLGTSDKMRGLSSMLSLFFRNEFNEINNTGARMLDSIYHMILKLMKNCIFVVQMSRFCHI